MDTLSLTRRRFLQGAAMTTAAGALGGAAAAVPGFTFVHITDTHIQPELGAARGVQQCFHAIAKLSPKPAFALVGGDLVMDANKVDKSRADLVYGLWQDEAAKLGLPLYYSIGNHDLFGLDSGGKPLTQDPDFGKALWKRRLGISQNYWTFDYHGWKFITLDSVGVAPNGTWQGIVNKEQLTWLDNTLRAAPPTMPIVVLTHMPLFTLYPVIKNGPLAAPAPYLVVTNGDAVRETFAGRNVRAVLQGHTHIVEDLEYRSTRYISGGAVCGNWWKGPQLGVHPEGFSVVTVKNDDLNYQYVPYGWQAVPV